MSRIRIPALAAAMTAAAALSFTLAPVVHATPIDPQLQGDTSHDGWADLTSATYNPPADYGGSFPGASAWTAPIASNQPGSGDAAFDKVAGNGFASGASIYVGGFSFDPNTLGGAFTVTDSTPLSNLQTVVFQIDIGTSFGGYSFHDNVLPTLSYNGASQALTGDAQLLSHTYSGTAPVQQGQGEALYIDAWLIQWDLTGVTDPINSLDIDWSVVQHGQIYALRLDQSNVYTPALVPEPTSIALMMMGGSWLLMRRKRRQRA